MATKTTLPRPEVVSQETWLNQRKKLLLQEKEVTRHGDRVSAELRRMPMVRVDKEYSFDSHDGSKSLTDLFDGQVQLIVYHFMFDPKWDRGCPGCTGFVNALGDLSMLQERNTNFVLISRAPLEKLLKYKEENRWTCPWYSSFNSDFNYDYHVTLDESKTPIEYNFRTKEESAAHGSHNLEGEAHGLSVFFRDGNEVFHTYSSYARGVESLTDSYRLLDVTPYGRQEDWEDSPAGWPQKPTYR